MRALLTIFAARTNSADNGSTEVQQGDTPEYNGSRAVVCSKPIGTALSN